MIVIFWILVSHVTAFAIELGAEPLSFQQWRAHRILHADNQITRLKNAILITKNNSGNINKINNLEASLRVAYEHLETAKNLTIADYFNYYLNDFSAEDRALYIAARKMSKKETAMLLKALLQSKGSFSRRETVASHSVQKTQNPESP